jgi:hypothetical protein
MATPEFQALIDQAKANEDAEAAAVTLLQALGTKIASIAAQLAASPQATQLTQLASDLNTSAAALGAAIVAGTPAA